jgi:hypothetical protein
MHKPSLYYNYRLANLITSYVRTYVTAERSANIRHTRFIIAPLVLIFPYPTNMRDYRVEFHQSTISISTFFSGSMHLILECSLLSRWYMHTKTFDSFSRRWLGKFSNPCPVCNPVRLCNQRTCRIFFALLLFETCFWFCALLITGRIDLQFYLFRSTICTP